MPDVLAQFLENQRATVTQVSTYVLPDGLLTVTVEFEPYEDDDEA